MILSADHHARVQLLTATISDLFSQRKGMPKAIVRIFDALEYFSVHDDALDDVRGLA
jgi:hypothetical protein